MGVFLGLAGVGIALAALFGSRRRRRRRRRRAEDVPARRFGRPPLELSGAELYVVWAGKTWSRAEAYAGLHEIIDPFTLDQLVIFLRDELTTAFNVAEFLAVVRWAGIEADISVRIADALAVLLAGEGPGRPVDAPAHFGIEDRERWVREEDAYFEREVAEGRPI